MVYGRDFTTPARRRGVALGATVLTTAWALAACAPVTSQYSTQYSTRTAAADSVVRDAVRRERSIQATTIPVNTIGVMPLTVRSADTSYAALGYGLAALMASDLARSRSLIVVERLRLDAVMRELNFVASGRVDSTAGPRAGRLVGARRMILGALTIRPNGALQLGSQVANASSGAIDATLSGNATVTQIFDAEKSMVFKLFDALGVTLSPAERRTIERVPTRNLSALLEYSNGVRAEVRRDIPNAILHYNNAARIDPAFTEARASATAMQGPPPSVAPGTLTGAERAAQLSTDLVNRPTPILVGSGVDATVTRQQLLTITITVRTP